jgi:hypothetical protein
MKQPNQSVRSLSPLKVQWNSTEHIWRKVFISVCIFVVFNLIFDVDENCFYSLASTLIVVSQYWWFLHIWHYNQIGPKAPSSSGFRNLIFRYLEGVLCGAIGLYLPSNTRARKETHNPRVCSLDHAATVTGHNNATNCLILIWCRIWVHVALCIVPGQVLIYE